MNCYDGSTPYLLLPLTIELKNPNKVPGQISKIEVSMVNPRETYEVYDSDGKITFPKTLAPNTELTLTIAYHLPLEAGIVREIRSAYDLSANVDSAKLGTFSDFVSTIPVSKWYVGDYESHGKIWITSESLGGTYSEDFCICGP